ncbi:phage tail protein [Escherichia coli]
MLYNTGTIAINGNSATGTGTNWTAPASQVRAGQTIIVMSNPVQLFQISSVNSATSMTVTPAASPALSGQKYGILVSDNISVDGLAQAMSQLINEYDENIGAWETFASTSANQLVTVTINGTSLSIPAIGGLARKGANSDITELKGLTTALSIAQGGTGAKTAADARTNLGLDKFAQTGPETIVYSPQKTKFITIKDNGDWGVWDTTGNSYSPLQPSRGGTGSLNAWGLGGAAVNASPLSSDEALNNFTWFYTTSNGNSYGGAGHELKMSAKSFDGLNNYSATWYANATTGRLGVVCVQTKTSGAPSNNEVWRTTLWSGRNTTVDSGGFIKSASPVVKLFDNGSYETNDESQGCTVTRQGVGEYLIEGCTGLNADAAWGGIDGGFDIPTDRNKQPLLWLDYEVNADGSVLVKTYHRTHPNAPEFARNDIEGLADGDPVDIPADQFVSVRVQMPACSIWNQKQSAVIDTIKEAEVSRLDDTSQQ